MALGMDRARAERSAALGGYSGGNPFAQGFLQLAEGKLSQGTVYLARPGKMRIEYDPPVRRGLSFAALALALSLAVGVAAALRHALTVPARRD